MSNSAILDVLVQQQVGPCDLNDYPASLANAPLASIVDGLGYSNRDCGSYVAWMVQHHNGVMLPKSQLGLPGTWPETLPASYIIPEPVPGCIAIVPSLSTLPNGHCLYVSSVVQGTTNQLVTKSYNSESLAMFQLAVWATTGDIDGVNFSLVYAQFPEFV